MGVFKTGFTQTDKFNESMQGLGPGIVREKTLGGVTSFVPFSCQ